MAHSLSMFAELPNTRQVAFEGYRRWFTDPDMDLIVWYEDESLVELTGFQLCYDKRSQQHALTWTISAGFQLSRIDDGEVVQSAKMSPVLIPANDFDAARLIGQFLAAANPLEYGLVTLVKNQILEYEHLKTEKTAHSLADPNHHILNQVILDNLRDCFYGPGLHGPELFPTLQQFSASQALVSRSNVDSPSEEPLSIWQIALHCAYWKHSISKQLALYLGLPQDGKTPESGLEDWVAQPEGASEADWQACLETLRLEHENLVAVVTEMLNRRPQALSYIDAKSGMPWSKMIYSMANHDAYHSAHVRNLGISLSSPQ